MYSRFDGGRLIGKALAQAGTRYLFCLHGGHIDPILYGCAAEGIRLVDVRHEAAAVHMAEGWALATGQTGVCAVTAGPGVANAVTGLANAFQTGSPLLCLAGHCPAPQSDSWTLQDLDQLPIVRPVTKWARSCGVPERCGEYAVQGLLQARHGRPGPAYLEIPMDVLARKIDGNTGLVPLYRPPAPPGPGPQEVSEAAALLAAAERPIVLAGSGSFWSGAGMALAELARQAGLPVFTANAGRGVLPDGHPWAAGHAGPAGGAFGEILKADLVLCLGARLGFPFLHGKFLAGKKLIRVDLDAAETSLNRPGDLNVACDARLFCEALSSELRGPPPASRAEWLGSIQAARERGREMLYAQASKSGGAIHPAALVEAIGKASTPSTTLVADGGDILAWGLFGLPAHGPGQLLSTSAYFGCLGVGIPYAIAARLARPSSPVFLLEGD
ncbi:MAG: thiamine pyrophosphate-binding protein, partial [Bdellovibrionota bacterium]